MKRLVVDLEFESSSKMDEPSKASQSAGSGQSHQRPVNHSRPFFYVQPPIQPFYTYQWHMNNPYSHNVPGAGFHFGRPCMMPYSYLQYPGYVLPHAAMHPVDHRRVYERSFPPAASATAYDFSFRQHQHAGAHRETTCAGAQTDPCEALNKLIECLDQLRAGEELHSRVDSQTSGTLSPLAEEEEEETAGKMQSGFNTAEPDTKAGCSVVEHLDHQEDGTVESGKEPSLDNSSVQEESSEVQDEEDGYVHEDCCVQSQNKSENVTVQSQGRNRDEKVPDRNVPEPSEGKEWDGPNGNLPSSQSSPVHHSSARTIESQDAESARNHPADISGDYSCCILHLPFEKVLNAGVYGPGCTTRSLGSPFSYSYCPPQLSHERISVLSPSLDELSSHDELLSTDPEDMGLFPARIYSRGKLAEVASRKSHPSVGEIHADMCVFYPKRLTCAVCGSNAFKECSRPKAFHCETHCYGDVDDSDEEAVEGKSGDWEMARTCKHCLRGTAVKIQTAKKAHPHSKHRQKHREKLGELEGKPGHTEAPCAEHVCCEKCMSSPEKSSGHFARGVNARPFKERRCRTVGISSDQIVWEGAGGHARPKTCRAQPLPQRQARLSQRKCRLKPQGSRNDSVAADDGDGGDDEDDYDEDEEDEGEEEGQGMLQFHRGKGKKAEGMVVAAPQHPPGIGPQAQNIPHGPPPVQGPRPPVPGPFRGPHLDRQQQQNNWPFFYVPPSQPYVPYQWPMPVPYVPYGGFPGMGYGMVIPPLPPASYMEPPGYMLPHAQLHMADYRRMMAPHLAPAMAYQARRFRYQHTTPSGRVMVSSEVQTDPVGTESPHKGATSSQTNSESGSSSSLSSPKPHADTSACPEEAFGTTLGKTLADTVGTASGVSSAVPNSEILFQAEEVRIECSGTRAGLKIIHAKETTELASSGELLQCNMGSVHSAEDVVLRCYQPLPFEDDKQREHIDDLNHSDEQYLPACPDILMTGACPSSGSLEESDDTPAEPGNSTEIHTLAVQGDPSLVKGEDEVCSNSKNVHFKILRLPFDLHCLDELRQMEASVWSVESLVPYVPSTEWMLQNGLLTPQKPTLTTVMEVATEVPLEANPTAAAEAASTPQENLQAERMIELDGQDSLTSLESLPPYLPAASWLADFSNVYYSKLPSNVQQQVGNLRTWPEGQLGEKSEVSQDANVQSSVTPQKSSMPFKEPRSRHRSRTAALCPSNQDGCPVKSHLSMPHSPDHKVRICKSCLMKQRAGCISGSPSPKANCVKRHKVAHPHLTGDKAKVHLCAVCMCDPDKKSRCNSGVDDETTEGEVSENSLYPSVGPKKRAAEGQRRLHNNSQKVPSGRHAEKCPMACQSKLREQNCACEDPKGVPSSTQVWDSNAYGQHNDATLEKNDINMALYATERWRDTEPRFISQKQKEKSWRGGTQVSDTESTKSAGKIRTHKHKQYAPTPEIHRRDTRC